MQELLHCFMILEGLSNIQDTGLSRMQSRRINSELGIKILIEKNILNEPYRL